MHTFNILALFLLSLVTATPTPQTYTNDPGYFWSVTNWNGDPAHYAHDLWILIDLFNVSGPAYGNIPAFSAYCPATTGGLLGGPVHQCTIEDTLGGNRSISTRFLQANAEPPTIANFAIFYQFVDEKTGTEWNYTGYASPLYNNFNPPLLNFDVTPTNVSVVA